LRNRSAIWWISIRVLWRMTKWWCAPTRRPIYNPVHVSLPPNLLVQANPFAWSMATSEQERCIRLLLLILAGRVSARTEVRKRQKEFIALLT
jgi:hypothetical protein